MEPKRLEYFSCFNSYAKKTAKLSDEEVGRLFRALMEYNETGERRELEGRESVAFDFIADDIDCQQRKHEEKCAQNRANAGSRRNRTKASVSDRIRPLTDGEQKDGSKDEYSLSVPSKVTKKRTPEESDSDFDRFWEAYPKKTGKGAARKAFKAAKKKAPLEAMLSAVERQKQSFQWTQNGGQYIPSPARWLSEERWNDEIRENPPIERSPGLFPPYRNQRVEPYEAAMSELAAEFGGAL